MDNFEGIVKEIQARATIIETYDGRRVVIPNADLFTHPVTVNTALDVRRWEYDLTLKGIRDLARLKSLVAWAEAKGTPLSLRMLEGKPRSLKSLSNTVKA